MTLVQDAQRGFSLLEVMIALAVIAIALSALIRAGGDHARNAIHLRDRTLTQWVASNELARMAISQEFPEVGSRSGNSFMAGQEYLWTATISGTGVDTMRRVEISVAEANHPDSPISTLTGFVGKAQE